MGELAIALGWTFLLLSLLGVGYTVAAGAAVSWFFARSPSRDAGYGPVTILKPLHGDEPNLRACLDSFCTQDYPTPTQIVFGVRERTDPAIQVVNELVRDNPGLDIVLVIDDRLYGPNLKVSNLINMQAHIRHPVVVLADSDVTVDAGYLRRIVAALSEPGVGLVTCVYVGKPTRGIWSHLSAMAINYHFLPSVAFGIRTRLATPCFGPTIAMRKTTLDRIGGFQPFADHLADDYEIGRAIRDLGYRCAIPAVAIGHGCPEQSLRGLTSHELRWARTLRVIDPLSHAGSVVCHPLPWAVLAVLCLHASVASLLSLLAVVLARLFTMNRVDRATGEKAGARWLFPPRDVLSLAMHLSAFLVRSVHWRGHRFRIGPKGLLVPDDRAPATSEGSGPLAWTPVTVAGAHLSTSDLKR